MVEHKAHSKVDAIIEQSKWRHEFEALRAIVLSCGLSEELKWGQPCYSKDGKNIVLIHGFKDYCALLFMKGALLNDPNGILVQQTQNVQSARQIRFTDSGEIVQLRPVLEAYVQEALEVQKAGLQVHKKTTAEFEVADEFQQKLDAQSALKAAFQGLSPGRQRAYLLYFASAKRTETREARVEKSIPFILNGKGMDD